MAAWKIACSAKNRWTGQILVSPKIEKSAFGRHCPTVKLSCFVDRERPKYEAPYATHAGWCGSATIRCRALCAGYSCGPRRRLIGAAKANRHGQRDATMILLAWDGGIGRSAMGSGNKEARNLLISAPIPPKN